MHEVEKYTEGDINAATRIRLKFLEEVTSTNLKNIGSYSMDMSETAARNIENPIGCASIPLGIAGPIKLNGEIAQGEFYLPLATTEGALVASVGRGCSIITKSGGATVRILKNLMARAPAMKILEPPFVENAQILVNWIQENISKLKNLFLDVDPFADLQEIQTWVVGRTVFIRFLVFGIRSRKLAASVNNPGVIKNPPANIINNPSINSSEGTIPLFKFSLILNIVISPWTFVKYAPANPVRTIRSIVGSVPITLPISINSHISIIGTVIKRINNFKNIYLFYVLDF